MDENGGAAVDPQVILESPSQTTSSIKEMPDEPTAPRRNSTDDNDPTRPRKRPAVMAPAEEPNKHLSIPGADESAIAVSFFFFLFLPLPVASSFLLHALRSLSSSFINGQLCW